MITDVFNRLVGLVFSQWLLLMTLQLSRLPDHVTTSASVPDTPSPTSTREKASALTVVSLNFSRSTKKWESACHKWVLLEAQPPREGHHHSAGSEDSTQSILQQLIRPHSYFPKFGKHSASVFECLFVACSSSLSWHARVRVR